MLFEVTGSRKRLATFTTTECFSLRVQLHMTLKITVASESLSTLVALVPPFARVDSLVRFETDRLCERITTFGTLERLLARV